jgi:RNA polymerase sigma-70 factor (ECF subfamily)
MDDATLDRWATAYRAGETPRLRPLVEALARPLLAFAYRYVRDWDLAADLVQEAWLKIVANIASYDPGRSFATWARAILRNLCLSHLRKVARLPLVAALDVAGDLAAARSADDPQQAVAQRELAWQLGRAVAQLGATQREVFVRIALENESRAAVAADLGLSTGHLRVLLHLARRQLARLLALEEETS